MYKCLNKSNDLHTEDRTFEGDISVEDAIIRDDLTVTGTISTASLKPTNMSVSTIPATDSSKKLVDTLLTTDANGNLYHEPSTSQSGAVGVSLRCHNDETASNFIQFERTKNDSDVVNNDRLGALFFSGLVSGFQRYSSYIYGLVDGTPSSDLPTRLSFATTPAGSYNPQERMVIKSNGSVGIGTSSPETTSILDLTSTSQGFLPPRMTKVQRDAISTPAEGLAVFLTDTGIKKLSTYNGTNWFLPSWMDGSCDEVGSGSTITFSAVFQSGDNNYSISSGQIQVANAGNYKVQACVTLEDTAGGDEERGVQLVFENDDTSTTMLTSIQQVLDSADTGNEFANASLLGIITLAASTNYRFYISSYSGDTATTYWSSKCTLERVD